jgi:hypothetical protein
MSPKDAIAAETIARQFEFLLRHMPHFIALAVEYVRARPSEPEIAYRQACEAYRAADFCRNADARAAVFRIAAAESR